MDGFKTFEAAGAHQTTPKNEIAHKNSAGRSHCGLHAFHSRRIIVHLSFYRGKTRDSQNETANLTSQLATLSGTLSGSAAAKVGDIVPPFETVDLGGNRIQVAYDHSSRYLFYIFTPGCGACISQFSVWNHLTARAKTKNCLPLGVSLKSAELTKTVLDNIEQNFRVLIMPNEAIQRSYRVVAEPLVILVSADGVIDWVHYGTFGEEAESQMLSRIESGSL